LSAGTEEWKYERGRRRQVRRVVGLAGELWTVGRRLVVLRQLLEWSRG
jgi:hypothetical protein